MEPITPDEAMTQADKLANEIEADNKAIKTAEDSLSARRQARAERISRLAELQNVKGLSARQRGYIASALTESTPPHLRAKKGGTK